MNIMGFSIQDYIKKINRAITGEILISLMVTTVFLVIVASYVYFCTSKNDEPLSYTSFTIEEVMPKKETSLPFGSVTGKTYTFSWCQGALKIASKNKVYFKNEVEAKASGRTLSKLCSR